MTQMTHRKYKTVLDVLFIIRNPAERSGGDGASGFGPIWETTRISSQTKAAKSRAGDPARSPNSSSRNFKQGAMKDLSHKYVKLAYVAGHPEMDLILINFERSFKKNR